MLDNTSNPRAWINYIPTHGLIISGLIAVVALGLWVIPAARQWFWFIPDGLSWSVFWLVAAILVSSAYYFVRTMVTTTNVNHVTFHRFRAFFVAILLYFSGAFLLETLRIGPPVETWTLSSSAAVRFCILYTSFVVILNYLNQSNVLQSARPALVRYGVNIDTLLTILQIIILYFLCQLLF